MKTFNTIFELMDAFPDEQSAVDHFTAIRWKDGAFCPACGSTKVYHFSDKRTHKCGDCRKRFSIRVGTVFENSNISLRKWMFALWFTTNHKQGVSSVQLGKDIGVTQKTAWFMLQRLRHAMRTQAFNEPLQGHIECDETYIGGKHKNRHRNDPKRWGHGVAGKIPVIGAIARGGKAFAQVSPRTDTESLDGFVHKVVAPGSNVSTDEYSGYRLLGRTFNHSVVHHKIKEYANEEACTNAIESLWAVLKRKLYGVHIQVSPKHLNRYVNETIWRFNQRSLKEGERFNALIEDATGWLGYKELVA